MSETVNGKVGGTHSLNNSSTHTLIGRVASLLEVGTGFHPELTGRENIYFNGAIFGITISLLGLFRWANERYSLKYEDGNLL